MPFRTLVAAMVSDEEIAGIREPLAAQGVQVLHANSLMDALAASAPVFILDADGPYPWLALLQQVLRLRPAARVIMMSRRADDEMWIEMLSNGGYDLLPKPCHPKDVNNAVLGALESCVHYQAA